MRFDEIFIQYREALLRECHFLVNAINLYRIINERKEDRLQEMNIAPAFFVMVERCVLGTVVTSTNKLFGKKEECGFFDLLSMIEKNIDHFSIDKLITRSGSKNGNEFWIEPLNSLSIKDIDDSKKQISKLDSILKNIKRRRDKYEAHLDEEYFIKPDKLADDAPILWGDFDEIKKTVDDIFNFYSVSFDGKNFSIGVTNITDVNHLLSILHEDKERVRSEMRKYES
jgi:hypothetical protein